MNDRILGVMEHQGVTALALGAERGADAVVGWFAGQSCHQVVLVEDAEAYMDEGREGAPDLTVLSFEVMRRLSRTRSDRLPEFCDAHHVVLLLRLEQFLDSIAFLGLVDGVVFRDAPQHLRESLALAEAGYSILPSAAVMDVVGDRLRCEAVARLSTLDLALLEQMRLGETNRTISRFLAIAEATVKSKVRGILKVLKLNNRTEAAVFAARQADLIRAVIRQRLADSGLAHRTETTPLPASRAPVAARAMADCRWDH